MTNRQRQIIEFIGAYAAANGRPPTVREIGLHCGLRSSATVHQHIATLMRDGVITKLAGSPRSIQISSVGLGNPDVEDREAVLRDAAPGHLRGAASLARCARPTSADALQSGAAADEIEEAPTP